MKTKILTMTAFAAAFAAVALAGAALADGGGLNPQFVKWRKMKAAGFLPEQRAAAQKADTISLTPGRGGSLVGDDVAGQPVGLAPDVASLGYLSDMAVGRRGFAPPDGYPRRFDLREAGCVTGVRDQGKFETCWAFASFASLESSVLVQRPDSESYTAADVDFSERHLVDGHGYDLTPMNGGSMLMAMAYLLRWDGPASEAAAPYPAADATTWPTERLEGDGPRLHVQNVRWLPGKTAYLDNDEIKRNVMEKGGVYATFFMNTNRYYRASTAAYYCPYALSDNHGVTIVGWDDDYPGESFESQFLGLFRPDDGAYLVKNSWGAAFGQDGYFWISYYDRNFAVSPMAVFCGNESKGNYATIYQYDELGYTGKSHAGNNRHPNAWMANVFTPEADDRIAAVGFYALAPNVSYAVRVYVDCPDDATTDRKGPAGGTLVRKQTGRLDYAGYATIPLVQPVDVKAGSRFAVCVQIAFAEKTFDGYGNVVNPLPYEAPVEGYSSRAGAARGQSYYSKNGETWYDLADSVRGANFCLKAYGSTAAIEPSLKELAVTGPSVILAGGTGTFAATCVYDDGSTWTECDVEYAVVSDSDGVIQDVVRANNAVTVAIRPNLAEDSRIVLRLSYEDGGVTVSREFAVAVSRGAPSAPSGLRATAGDDAVEAGVRLAWDAVTNAAAYAVYRSDGGDSRNATYLATVEGTKYTDLTATPGTDYTYFLKAQNASGSSDFSAGATGWRRLAAPVDLVASDGDYDDVQLTWKAVEGARYYRVVRDVDMDAEGNPTANATVLTGADGLAWTDRLAFRDTPPEKGTNYVYWVQAALSFTGYRPSAWSIFDFGSRAAPVTLTAVRIDGPARVDDGGTATYTLAATLSNGDRVDPVTNAVWTTSLGGDPVTGGAFAFTAAFADGAIASNALVTVSASWTLGGADGVWTKADAKGVVVVPRVPAKPNAVKVAAATVDGVSLAWTAVPGASAYRLYRSEADGEAQLLTTTDGLAYLDGKAMPGVACRYWVEAVNASGTSPRSDASAAAMRQFSPPVYVTAANGASTESVQVSWRAVTGARRYRVSRADAADGEPHALSGWIEGRTFSDATAEPGRTYWYFVQAAFDEDGGSASAYSAATVGKLSADRTLAFLEIDGPSSIQYDSQGAFTCTATYANGAQKRVIPTWSFKSVHSLVSVSADGLVSAGHVTGSDLYLELQASYTDNGVTKTDSFAVTVVALADAQPAAVFVSNVVVRARWPWNGLVDVSYDLYSSPATARAVVTLSGHDHDLDRALQATTLSGDGVDAPAAGGAPHRDCRVTWDLGADYPNFHASAFSVALGAAAFAVAPPADFRASDNATTNGVELAWEAAFGAESYEIYRQRADGSDEKARIASVTNATAFLDATADYGESYRYWIRTVAGEFEADVSDEAGPATGKRLKPPSVKPAVNLQNGLVAYYPLDGSLDDRSGNGLHVTLVTGDDPTPAEARSEAAGTAFAFAGQTRLNVSTNSPSVLQDSFTFSAWVKTDVRGTLRAEQKTGFNTGCNFVVHPSLPSDSGAAAYGLSADANGVNLFEFDGDSLPAVLRHPADLGTGWHFVCFTVEDGAAPILYVDGSYAKTGLSTGRAKRLFVGELLAGGAFGGFTGTLDDVCYYDRALDAEEVAALHEAGSPLVAGKPVSTAPTVDVAYADGAATVTISCVEPGADADVQPTVYYTILREDGGETVDAREYTVPFTVAGDATVVAWSVKDGYYDSPRRKVAVKAAWRQTAHDALAPTDGSGEVAFATFGDGDWVFDPNVSSDNADGSMRSGAIGADGVSSMSATVTGEGQFAFDWKVSSESGFDFLTVTVDGETAHKISGEVDWTELVLELTNDAPHVVMWTYAKDAGVDRGGDCGWVDHVTWVPLGSTVDSPIATVTPLGEGADCGASNEVALACAKVTGATIECRVDLFGEEGDWMPYDGPFTITGEATVYARAKKSGYVDSFVSRTEVKRPWVVRVGEALLMDPVTKDAVTLVADYYEYGTDEAFWWDQDREVVSDGTCASVRSPTLGDGPANDPAGVGASIFAKVSGRGTLYFDWKVDSEAGWDCLTYYAGEGLTDYAYAEAISGDRDWARVKLVFTADSPHVIEWEYNKDDRGREGRDCGWVDFLQWVPARFAPATPDPRIGYVFGGWATNETGEVVYDAGEQMDAEDPNETFVAVWTPISYTVAYVAQPVDGASTEQAFAYDEAQTLFPVSNFVFARGYSFKGWATEKSASAVQFADAARVSNLASEADAVVRLYPVLSPISYTVAFVEDGEPAADAVAATYDVEFAFPTPAAREGWRFDGWCASPGGEVVYAAGATAKNLAFADGATVTFHAAWTRLADTLAQAADAPDLAFETSGDAAWFVQTETVKVGASALRSGAISGGQSSVLTAVSVATERTRVTFWWKVSSEPNWDVLKFAVNGKAKASVSGLDGDWQLCSAVLPAGTNTLEWTYAKDGTGDRGEDCGWVDGLAFEPAAVEKEDEPIVEPTAAPVFKVIQYCINKQPYTVDDAVAATNTPAIWKRDPVTETYDRICFRDNALGVSQNFQSSAVQWPATILDGYKSDYFACQVTGTVNVPEAGAWTFCVGSDDGYRLILTDEDGKTYTMEHYRDRSYANDLKTFNFAKVGRYKVYVIYFEYVETSILEISCAKGSQRRFSSSKFRLLGTPESGITLVGSDN